MNYNEVLVARWRTTRVSKDWNEARSGKECKIAVFNRLRREGVAIDCVDKRGTPPSRLEVRSVEEGKLRKMGVIAMWRCWVKGGQWLRGRKVQIDLSTSAGIQIFSSYNGKGMFLGPGTTLV